MHCHAVLVFEFHAICLRQLIKPSQPSTPNLHTLTEGGFFAMFSTPSKLTNGTFPPEFWVKINMEHGMIVYKWPRESQGKALMSSCIFWVIGYRSVIYTDTVIFFPVVVNLFIWSGGKLLLYLSNNGLLFSFTRISHRLVRLKSNNFI